MNDCFAGIDVAKDWLDIAVTSHPVQHIANTDEAIDALIPQLRDVKRIVLEASGGYEKRARERLSQAGLAVFVVNPRQVRDFARATGQLAKTDALDAQILAQYARVFTPHPPVQLSQAQQQLKALVVRRRQLVDTLAQEKTQLKKADNALVQTSIQVHLGHLKALLKTVETQIQQLLKTDAFLRRAVCLFKQIPGLGLVSMATLLSELPELGHLDYKQIAKLGGLAPLNADSGRFRGARHTWGGRQSIRNCLYMAVLSARKCNPDIAPFYQRLIAQGKPFKVVITACMRKLLVIINARFRDALLAA
jgi:transposase